MAAYRLDVTTVPPEKRDEAVRLRLIQIDGELTALDGPGCGEGMHISSSAQVRQIELWDEQRDLLALKNGSDGYGLST